ncbi:hypothetical protein mRhiFer1_009596 [Rhinolophus ferrumequinum]|uniref:Uncharacterized protein n=1 Tax=Rhinolophus ferrumequinum TaxID=59479 RepID=A0A7J7ZQS9_RHIFE|nr:hypothetical protein mRhiFer1_009596 [Rhinolophus ferrumequinum]
MIYTETFRIQRVTGFQSAMLATGVLSKVIESWFSKNISVRHRGIGDLTIPKAVILQNLLNWFPNHQYTTLKPTSQANFVRSIHLFLSHSGVYNSSFGCLWENISSRSTAVKMFLPKRIIMQAN